MHPALALEHRAGASQKRGPALGLPTSEAAAVLPPLLILQAGREKIRNQADSVTGQMHKETESAILG